MKILLNVNTVCVFTVGGLITDTGVKVITLLLFIILTYLLLTLSQLTLLFLLVTVMFSCFCTMMNEAAHMIIITFDHYLVSFFTINIVDILSHFHAFTLAKSVHIWSSRLDFKASHCLHSTECDSNTIKPARYQTTGYLLSASV